MKLFRVATKLLLTGTIIALGKSLIDAIEDTNTIDYKSVDERMKECQNELARLYDIVSLNNKRESTKQVSKIEISIDGKHILDRILELEQELGKLLKIKNQ